MLHVLKKRPQFNFFFYHRLKKTQKRETKSLTKKFIIIITSALNTNNSSSSSQTMTMKKTKEIAFSKPHVDDDSRVEALDELMMFEENKEEMMSELKSEVLDASN